MKFLRTASTSRLLAVIAGLVVAIAAGTAIAVAASGPGPVPPPKPLATAIHDALAAPKVPGISARVTFTNNLIGASDLAGSQASDPILTGASGRLWLGDHRLRLELQSSNGDAQVVVNQNSFWISDPSSNTVYEGTLPAGHASTKPNSSASDGIPRIAQIESDLTKLMGHVNISGALPSDVAGQAAYTVRISPKHDGGLLGSAEVAWDAVRGVPLRVAIYASGNPTPVLEIRATDISYGAVPTSDFDAAPPAGAKVVKISTATPPSATAARLGKHAHHPSVSGVAAVSAALPFKLDAPSSLNGVPRHTVQLLSWGGKPAALVTYGQYLGGVAVIEQTQSASSAAPSSSQSSNQGAGGPSGLSLPTVSINGATGQELDTALGTMIRFNRGGVSYTVLGSVSKLVAVAAARAL